MRPVPKFKVPVAMTIELVNSEMLVRVVPPVPFCLMVGCTVLKIGVKVCGEELTNSKVPVPGKIAVAVLKLILAPLYFRIEDPKFREPPVEAEKPVAECVSPDPRWKKPLVMAKVSMSRLLVVTVVVPAPLCLTLG